MVAVNTSTFYYIRKYLLGNDPIIRKKLKQTEKKDNVTNINGTSNVSKPNDIEGEISLADIIQALNVANPSNRLAILKLFNHEDMVKLLHLMEKNDLLLGLKFFDRKSLLKFVMHLPKEQLVKMLKVFYTNEEILKFMSIKAVSEFLGSSKIKPTALFKAFEELPVDMLAKILEGATWEKVGNKSKNNLLKKLYQLPQELIVEGMRSLPHQERLEIVSKLVDKDESLLMEFQKKDLMRPIFNWQKTRIIESMQVLDDKLIIDMLSKLPQNHLSKVLTLLDPEKFVQALVNFHSNLLLSLAA